MKKYVRAASLILMLSVFLISLVGCTNTPASDDEEGSEDPAEDQQSARMIELSGDSATLDGDTIEEFDYTWHCDPSVSHDEVDNAPAEYYTGTKPETDAAAYIDRELYYYPELSEDGFRLVNYDGEEEWAYYYTDGEHDDYIFATLPKFGNSLPTQMMHSEQEAAENKVLHITEAGTYILKGEWKGQIWVDLGDKDDTFTDDTAKVTLIFAGADISCSVAPAVVFYSAYECDWSWEDNEIHSESVSTDFAGVNVIIADGTENSVTGTNVFRMLKTRYKDENSADEIKLQKKLRKTDAAFYSYVSMNISGEDNNSGALTVTSGFEGLDSELHMTINGGNIIINSQDDGMNVNEDGVSVLTVNGGSISINAAQGAEGDGIDSNGFVVLNGGTVSVNGVKAPDSAIDTDCGIYYNGGTVIIDGTEQSYTAGDVFNETGRTGAPDGMGEPPRMPEGEQPQMPGDGQMPMEQSFDIKDFKEKVAALGDDATIEDVMALLGGGMQKPEGQRPQEQQPQQPPQQ